ncbi:MAG: SUMF1/EgtB/PvdO family nonheme iron enzyme [Holophagales bacterium]|nr:SUMF1/EgtB/PvdO family nonheme iron enzyme [Holophagales bacterium]
MVRIPAGTFRMGSPEDERGRNADEGPQREVAIGHDFYLGKYEVTQAQWRAVMGALPAMGHGAGDTYPVYYVSWNDVAGPGGFLAKVNASLGPAKRLPRGGREPFSFGTTRAVPRMRHLRSGHVVLRRPTGAPAGRGEAEPLGS